MLIRILTTIASIITIGFGVWHFFVPKAWNWYTYIDAKATELILAVQAINIFFSLSLVILWMTRSILQIAYPQGSINPILQYGMLSAFLVVTACYILAFVLTLVQKSA